MMSGNTKESLAETVAVLNLDRTKLYRMLAAARADADRLAGALRDALETADRERAEAIRRQEPDDDHYWDGVASAYDDMIGRLEINHPAAVKLAGPHMQPDAPDVPETDCGNMPPEPPGNPRRLDPPAGPETDCATTDAWQPIATAPKDGAEILGWRLDAGVMLIRWDAPEHFLSDGECEAMGGNAEKFDWMFADFGCGDRLEGDEVPTLWQPLPTDPSPRSRTNQGRPALQPGR